jgi:hypothetical protein
MMKPAPPSLESYMNSILKGNVPNSSSDSKSINLLTNPASGAVLQEMNKLRQLQAKKQELQQQMSLIDSQILKTQGALEVLQSLGITFARQ